MKLDDLTPGDIVCIQYEDITEVDKYTEDELNNYNCIKFEVYGKLLAVTKKHVVVIMAEDLSGKEHHSYLIPRGCVSEVTLFQKA